MPKKSEFIKLMQKGEVDDSYNMRGDSVASSRSSPRKTGQQAQDEFTKQLTRLVKKIEGVMNVDTMVGDRVPEVVLDFKKKDKKKLN